MIIVKKEMLKKQQQESKKKERKKKASNPTAQNSPWTQSMDISPGFQNNKRIDGLRAENWEREGHGCKQDVS